MSKFPRLIPLAAVAMLALAGCTAAPEEPSADAPSSEPVIESTPEPTGTPEPEPTSTPEPTPTPTPTTRPNCVHEKTGWINLPGDDYATAVVSSPELAGWISDGGPREYATGEPALNDDGQIVSYTVQAGESLDAIATRFCINTRTLGILNHTNGYEIQPGQVLVLRPAPNEPWSWKD